MLRNSRLVYDNRFTNKWWLVDGIAESACTAAWQPKGAPSYEASKLDIANRGLYDAYEGVAPSWDRNNGWKFSGAQYLRTLVSINRTGQTKSLFARFSGHPTGTGYQTIVGSWGGSGTDKGRFWLSPEWGANKACFANGGELQPNVTGGYSAGVIAVIGSDAYLNGVDIGNVITGDITGTTYLSIGSTYLSTGYDLFYIGYIQAIAEYSISAITSAQALGISNAMAAL